MKKILSVILSAVILTSVFACVIPAGAAGTPTIQVAEVTGAHYGDTVNVPIQVVNNPGIAVMRVEVSYDTTLLRLTGVTPGNSEGIYSYSHYLTDHPYSVYWDDSLAPDNYTGDFTLATLTFEVIGQSGTSNVSVSYNPNEIFDTNLDNVSFAIDNGSVSIASLPDIGLANEYLAQYHEEQTGIRVFFAVNSDAYQRSDVIEIGAVVRNNSKSTAALEVDPQTGNLVNPTGQAKATVFKNGVQTGNIYSDASGVMEYTVLLMNLTDLDKLYDFRAYAIVKDSADNKCVIYTPAYVNLSYNGLAG